MGKKATQNFVGIIGNTSRGWTTVNVYEATNDGLAWIGNTRYQPGANKGQTCEIVDALVYGRKIRPAILKRLNATDYGKSGYFTQQDGNKAGLRISIIYPPTKYYPNNEIAK